MEWVFSWHKPLVSHNTDTYLVNNLHKKRPVHMKLTETNQNYEKHKSNKF